MLSARLRKGHRLRSYREFQQLKEHGKRFRTEHFLVNYQLLEENRLRVGVMTSRKLKKAVARNRAKRVVREFWRLNRNKIQAQFQAVLKRELLGLEMVIVAYPGAEKLSYQKVSQELSQGFEKELRHWQEE